MYAPSAVLVGEERRESKSGASKSKPLETIRSLASHHTTRSSTALPRGGQISKTSPISRKRAALPRSHSRPHLDTRRSPLLVYAPTAGHD